MQPPERHCRGLARTSVRVAEESEERLDIVNVGLGKRFCCGAADPPVPLIPQRFA
jgi:hypothetical protein